MRTDAARETLTNHTSSISIDLGTDARGWKIRAHEEQDALVEAGAVFYADEDGLHVIPEPIVESARIEARKDAAAFVQKFGEACDAERTDWPFVAWENSETRARLVGEGWVEDDVYCELGEICAVYVATVESERARLVGLG